MTLDWWLTYLLTTLILSLSPGSGAINTMSTGISHGYRGAAASIAGLQVGLSAHIVLVGIGLGALISQSLLAFELLKWLGAAYGVARHPAMARRRGAGSACAGGQHAAPPSVPPRGAGQPDQPEKHRVPRRAVPAVYLAQSATGRAVSGARRHYRGGGYSGDDRLRHHGDAHRRLAETPRQMQLLNRVFGSLFILVAGLLATARKA